MFRIAASASNTYAGNKFVLSAPTVLRNLKAFRMDARLSEMLFTTQAQSGSKDYQRQAVLILVALSANKLTPQFQNLLRSNMKHLSDFVIDRYDATVQRKPTSARLTPTQWQIIEDQAVRSLMPTFKYEIVR